MFAELAFDFEWGSPGEPGHKVCMLSTWASGIGQMCMDMLSSVTGWIIYIVDII